VYHVTIRPPCRVHGCRRRGFDKVRRIKRPMRRHPKTSLRKQEGTIMKANLSNLLLVVLAGLVLRACGRSSVQISSGALSVINAEVMSAVSAESASRNKCPGGGIIVNSGHDRNWNHILDRGEIELVQFICNGMNGAGGGAAGVPALIKMVAEPAGANCSAGGQ